MTQPPRFSTVHGLACPQFTEAPAREMRSEAIRLLLNGWVLLAARRLGLKPAALALRCDQMHTDLLTSQATIEELIERRMCSCAS